MNLSQSTNAIGAAPIGKPGCPELAFSMACIDKKRIELIQRFSTVLVDGRATTIFII